MIKQWRLELDEVEKRWKALAWEVEMEEKKPGLLVKKKAEWIELVQKVEFIQGSSKDGGARVEEAEELEEAEDVEEDGDEEMGLDEAGGEAEVQAEMGATLPPSQPPM